MMIDSIFFDFLMLASEFILFGILAHKVTDHPFPIGVKEVLFIIASAIFSTYMDMFHAPFTWITGQAIYCSYCILFSKAGLPSRFLLYAYSYSAIILIQFLLLALFQLIPFQLTENKIPVVGNLMTFLAVLLLLRMKLLQKLYRMILQSAPVYRMLFSNSYLTVIALFFCLKFSPPSFYHGFAYFITVISVLIAVNAYLLYYDHRLTVEKDRLTSYQKNLPLYQALIDEIRASQHEYANRIQTLENLAHTCPDHASLKEALLSSTTAYKAPLQAYPLLQLDMPLLAASIYNIYQKAADKDVSILFDISITKPECPVPEYILSDLAGILLNNALDECENNDSIYLHMSQQDGHFFFEVRNPLHHRMSPENFNAMFSKGYSTKQAEKKTDHIPHGLGLYSLSNQIRECGGNISTQIISYDDTEWIVFEISF